MTYEASGHGLLRTNECFRTGKTKDIEPNFRDDDPGHTAIAYESTSGMFPTLAFLVPIVSVFSCVPAALVWYHSPHQVGALQDADFYQMLTNTTMQLRSVVTVVVPTLYNNRLIKQAWFCTWILAACSTFCAIVAVPLYLVVPTEWSFTVSFAGSVAQAFVTLQLVFAI